MPLPKYKLVFCDDGLEVHYTTDYDLYNFIPYAPVEDMIQQVKLETPDILPSQLQKIRDHYAN